MEELEFTKTANFITSLLEQKLELPVMKLPLLINKNKEVVIATLERLVEGKKVFYFVEEKNDNTEVKVCLI